MKFNHLVDIVLRMCKYLRNAQIRFEKVWLGKSVLKTQQHENYESTIEKFKLADIDIANVDYG